MNRLLPLLAALHPACVTSERPTGAISTVSPPASPRPNPNPIWTPTPTPTPAPSPVPGPPAESISIFCEQPGTPVPPPVVTDTAGCVEGCCYFTMTCSFWGTIGRIEEAGQPLPVDSRIHVNLIPPIYSGGVEASTSIRIGLAGVSGLAEVNKDCTQVIFSPDDPLEPNTDYVLSVEARSDMGSDPLCEWTCGEEVEITLHTR